MSDQKRIILLVGESGSGKTRVSTVLREKYGWTDVCSYTTRDPRFEGEYGHIFVTEEEFNQIPEKDRCAYTLYNGHQYCATHEQADAADIYVIDPDGIEFFKTHYTGFKIPVVVYLEVPEAERIKRMKKRGDEDDQIQERIENDREKFAGAKAMADTCVLGTLKPETIARRLWDISKGR